MIRPSRSKESSPCCSAGFTSELELNVVVVDVVVSALSCLKIVLEPDCDDDMDTLKTICGNP